ncbi:MAG: V-type ATP synthase subunit A [Candidatus Parvarchaeota archaeon]|nr:V-type ATP synthase subunit A [Candidatus Parvarchaeota archaeon]
MEGIITKVSGAVVEATHVDTPKMNDMVRVGFSGLVGEIVRLQNDKAVIQVYEDTTGLRVGDRVVNTHTQLSVKLAPGLLGSIFDGIQRPLEKIMAQSGDFMAKGVDAEPLDTTKKWKFIPSVKKGSIVKGGQVIGEVQETSLIKHRVMVPLQLSGELKFIEEGEFTINQKIAVIADKTGDVDIIMLQEWPVRLFRPVKEKLPPEIPLITGQRVLDSFFPIAKGGTAAIPGPFGSGKTVTQHSLAEWSDADIIVYVGCGERGNEMTEMLTTLPKLKDPKSGKSLMDRTILIANTSNMPVAAREASIYTGAAMAEYYRDMGYNVALMADSTSRWAEALRELSGRLEEMPGEEGYPAYLSSRIADFYERAGRVRTLGGDTGSLTLIGAVSPAGGDISEPVSQSTLRVTRVFWALDSALANARHFPAINWLNSYSLYEDDLTPWYKDNIARDWPELKKELMTVLAREAEINEIVQLVGYDALPDEDKMILDIAKIIKEDFLQQNAFDQVDAFSSIKKQYQILSSINELYSLEKSCVSNQIPISVFSSVRAKDVLAKMKYITDDKLDSVRRDFEVALEEIKNNTVVKNE